MIAVWYVVLQRKIPRSLCLYFCLALSFGMDIFCRSLFSLKKKRNLRPLDGDFIGYMGDSALLLDGSLFSHGSGKFVHGFLVKFRSSVIMIDAVLFLFYIIELGIQTPQIRGFKIPFTKFFSYGKIAKTGFNSF